MPSDGGSGRVLAQADEAAGTSVRIELRPHCSLTPQGARCFFAFTCAITLGASTVAAAAGAWPALIFAVLELLLIRWALQRSLERGRGLEVIEVTEREVLIAVCTRERRSDTAFARHWARVTLQPAMSRMHPSRLLVECQGRRCELGAFLTEDERVNLAARLKRLIGRTNESPALTT